MFQIGDTVMLRPPDELDPREWSIYTDRNQQAYRSFVGSKMKIFDEYSIFYTLQEVETGKITPFAVKSEYLFNCDVLEETKQDDEFISMIF